MNGPEIINLLKLEPHPEGGHFRETFRDSAMIDGRSAGTAIHFLLQAGEVSHWHRVDATEIWHYYAGAPLRLQMSEAEDKPVSEIVLGPDIEAGAQPQIVVPANWWQSARSSGEWTLVGCTVSPGFEFSGFELAAPGWSP